MNQYTPSSTGGIQGSVPSPPPSYQPSERSEPEIEDGLFEEDVESRSRRMSQEMGHADQRHLMGIGVAGPNSPSPIIHTSLSFPTMSAMGYMLTEEGTIFDHSRTLLNRVMTSHPIQMALPHVIAVVHELPLPGLRHILNYLPVASGDSSHFMGWGEKSKTWPMGGRYLNRSSTG